MILSLKKHSHSISFQAKRPASQQAFCLFNHLANPINQPIYHAGGDAVDDDGAGNNEHLGRHAKDQPLRLKFDGGRYDGVGKAADGDDGARTGGRVGTR